MNYNLESFWSVITVLLALAIVQATFQLGVSVLTLLSGHSLGKQRSLRRLFSLSIAYIIGNFMMLMLVFGALLYVVLTLMYAIEPYAWLLFVVASCIVALAVMLVYYRRGSGTVLWLPRPAAAYLSDRAHRTKNVFEAFMLGGAATLAELPFTIAPLAGSAYIMMFYLVPSDHFVFASLYCLIVIAPLVITTVLIAGGHRLSTIQRWRETNKSFLQFAAAALLLAIALFVAVFYIAGGQS